MLAASCLYGCSLQNFGYLTQGDSADASEGGGPDVSVPDGDSPDGDDADSTAEAASDDGGSADAADATMEATADVRDASALGEDSPPAVDGAGPADAFDAGVVDAGSDAFGVGSLLANGSFEQGFIGWSVTPTAAMGTDAFLQYPVSGGHTVDGQYELATWSQSSAFTVKIYQTLMNVPNGTYTFQGYFNCGMNNQMYLYTKGCGSPDQQVNIPITAPTSWTPISINVQVTGGTCEVGFFVDAAATDWLNADAFTFDLDTSAQPTDAGADASNAADGPRAADGAD